MDTISLQQKRELRLKQMKEYYYKNKEKVLMCMYKNRGYKSREELINMLNNKLVSRCRKTTLLKFNIVKNELGIYE